MLGLLEHLIAAVVLGSVVFNTVRSYFQSDSEHDPIDEAKCLYAEGMIDEPELERRIEEAVDDDHEVIRLVVEDVNRVGRTSESVVSRNVM